MEISNLLGLPAHPLLVHAAVVLIPLAALGLAVSAVWPAARRHLGWPSAALALAAAALVPVVTGSGESLQETVTETALVKQHTEMGEQLTPWAFAMALLGLALLLAYRQRDRATVSGATSHRRWLTTPVMVGLTVLVLAATAGSTIQVARIGHSGAKAVWSGTATSGAAGAGG